MAPQSLKVLVTNQIKLIWFSMVIVSSASIKWKQKTDDALDGFCFYYVVIKLFIVGKHF